MFVVGSIIAPEVFVRFSFSLPEKKRFRPLRLSSSRSYAVEDIKFISPCNKNKMVNGRSPGKSFQLVCRFSSSRTYVAKYVELKQSPQDCNDLEESFLTNIRQHVKSPICEQDEYGHMYLSVMVQAMCFGGRKAVEVVDNYVDLCSLFSFFKSVVLEHLKSVKRSISRFQEISHVGKIAANGDKRIAELVAKAFEKVGKDGCFVFSEYKHESDNELEFLNQMRLDWEPISPVFITNQKKEIVLKNPLVLIWEDAVSYKNIAEQAIKWVAYGRPLLIVADDVEDKVVGSLILDKSLQKKVYVVKPSKFQENRMTVMQDLAIFTGGQVLTKTSDFNFIPQMLGSCKEVIMHYHYMIILGGSGCQAAIKERCEQMKSTIKLSTSTNEVELLEKRLKNLHYNVAVIKVKRESLAQARHILKDIKDAVQCGIVPGAGVAFLHASKMLGKLVEELLTTEGLLTEDFYGNIAMQLFQNALTMPVYTIAASAGFDGSFVIKKLLEQENPNLGFDPIKGEFVDVIKSGAWDQYRDIQSLMFEVIREFEEVCEPYYFPESTKHPWFCKPHFINSFNSFIGGVGACEE